MSISNRATARTPNPHSNASNSAPTRATPKPGRAVPRGKSGKLHLALRLMLAAWLPILIGSQFAPNAAGAGGSGAGGTGGAGGSPVVLPIFPVDSVVASTAPIRLPGGGGVSDNGAAKYSMPLDVPEGPGGLTPTLGLAYGASGNGPLGVGFNLTGLSAILPCNKTVASEGVADGVDFDRTDAYCLDGQKLVARNDLKLTEEAADVVMSTEVDNSVRVVMHRDPAIAGWADQEPNRFTVFHSDGRKSTYDPVFGVRRKGVSAYSAPTYQGHGTETANDSRQASVAIAYPIKRVTDRSGNQIRYQYDIGTDAANGDEASFRLRSIEYSFNGGLPRRRIDFAYETRSDSIVTYRAGVKVVRRSRLKTINVFAPNPTSTQQVWSYHLGYEYSPDTKRSRLKSIQKRDQFNVASYVRGFDWTLSDIGTLDHVTPEPAEFNDASFSRDSASVGRVWATAGAQYRYPENWVQRTDVRLLVFDTDGDGVDDVLYRTQPTRSQLVVDPFVGPVVVPQDGVIRLRRSTSGTVLGSALDVTAELEPADPDMHWEALLGKSRVADLDGDGRQNLLLARNAVDVTEEWSDPINNADFEGHWRYGFVDLGSRESGGWPLPTGDWTTAFEQVIMEGAIWREPSPWNDYMAWGYFTPPFQQIIADLDGDGLVERVDAFFFPNQTINASSSQYESVNWFRLGLPSDPVAIEFPYATALSSDEASARRTFIRVDDVADTEDWTCGNGRAVVTDYEGDGRADIFVASADEVPQLAAFGVYRRLSAPDEAGLATTSRRTSELWAGDCIENVPDLVMGDFNGDGLSDALYPPGSYDGNTVPQIRWNLGNGFASLEDYPVDDALLGDRMNSPQPISPRDGRPVGWDRGTRAADINGDGLTDIIAMRYEDPSFIANIVHGDDMFYFDAPKVIVAYLSTGTGFVGRNLGQWNADISVAEGFTTFQLGEVTGDGATDVVQVVDGKIVATELPWRAPVDLLRQVTDSSASYPLEIFYYASSWWGNGERPAPEPCSFPILCPRDGVTVVRQHANYAGPDADGGSRYRSTLHSYAHPRVHLRGRGFLGFEEHRIWDRQLGAETVRTFDNVTVYDPDPLLPGGEHYPYAGVAIEIQTTTPHDALPTDIELETAHPNFPGQSGDAAVVQTRTTVRAYEFELRWHEVGGGRGVLTRLPSGWDDNELDVAASAVDLNSEPRYDMWWTASAEARRESSLATVHDQHGQPISTTVSVDGGSTRSIHREYEDRVGAPPGLGSEMNDWWLGLVTLTEMRAPDRAAEDVGRFTRTTYDAQGRRTQIVTGARTFDCPPSGCVYSEVLATDTRVTAFDASGNPLAITMTATDSPTPRTLSALYDTDRVYPTQVTDALGFTVTTLVHPGIGDVVLSVDVNNVTTTTQFDGFGRPTKTSRPGSPTLSRNYGVLAPKGQIIDTYVQAGAPIDWAHSSIIADELGRPVKASEPGFNGAPINADTVYDRFGNIVWESNNYTGASTNLGTRTSYDRLGRVSRVIGPDWSVTDRDYTMFSTHTVDPLGRESYVDEDLEGRVIESGHIEGVDRKGEVKFGYTPFGEVETVEDAAGHVTTHEYDELGRRVRTDDPDRGLAIYHYDGFGQLLQETRANGDEIETTYDAFGRVTSVTGPGGAGASTYVYDSGVGAKHSLSSATSFDGITTTFLYDSLGRIVQTAKTVDGVTRKVDRRYDDWGRVTHLFYPTVSGYARFVTQYKYGTAGYLQHIADASGCGPSPNPADAIPVSCTGAPKLWEVLGRNADLSLTSAKFDNSQTEVREYTNDTGRLKKLTASGSTINWKYALDGNVKERFEGDGRREQFEYDLLDRLTRWTLTPPKGRTQPPDVVTTYDYSETGNLEVVRRNSAVTFVGVYGAGTQPNTLDVVSGPGLYSLTYDELGRQESGFGRTITWTHIDKPETITEAGVTTSFRYDAFGDRTVRETPSKKTIYFDKLHERRENGASVADVFMVHGEPGVVAQIEYKSPLLPTKRFMIGDDQASIALTKVGAAAATRDYFDPFGRRIDKDGNPAVDSDAATTMGYTGHEEDDGNLINMNGRMYDRKQYRFLSPDPVVSQPLSGQSYNPYSYVANNPLRYTDPSGYFFGGGGGGGEFTGYDEIEDGSGVPAGPGAHKGTGGDILDDTQGTMIEIVVTLTRDGLGNLAGGATVGVGYDGDSGASAGSEGPSTDHYMGDPDPNYVAPFVPITGFDAWLLDLLGAHDDTLKSAQDVSAGVGIAFGSAATGLWLAEAAAAAGWGMIASGSLAGAGGGLFAESTTSAYEGRQMTAEDALAATAGGAVMGGLGGAAARLGQISGTGVSSLSNGCKCFPAGTLVQTETGMVPIEDLREGDRVLSRDPDTGEIAVRPILNLSVRSASELVTVELVADDGVVTSVQATPEHPFWGESGWVDVDKLQPGDMVFSLESGWLRVGSATWVQTDALVYNFEVEDFHTYFVGDFGAWVHNSCCTVAPKHGSYTNTHESGKTYSGKGSQTRSQQSGRRKARTYNDPHVATDWTPAKSARDAFKQESRRMDANGGHESPQNYNKVESPGKQFRIEDGELP